MLIKKIKPKGSLFRYNPRVEEVCLNTGIKFYFDPNSQKFELAQNPYRARPVSNVTLNNDLSELQFDAVYRGKETHFVISIAHECDKIIYDFFSKVIDKGFSVMENDLDDIEVAFERGKLVSIVMYKFSKDCELLDSLRIKIEDEKAFLIKQCPWRKISLDTVKVSDGNIISKAENEEFIYRLEAQPLVFEVIKRLIESGRSV